MTTRVTIAGLSVLVERPTTETGPPLLFVHGYFARAILFERMMSWFAGHGHACYSIDLRGHGESHGDWDLGQVSIQDYTDDVVAVANELKNPVLIGHSMGGLLVQLAATRGCGRAAILLAPAPPRPIPVMSFRLAVRQARYMPAILASRTVHPRRADLREVVVNRMPESDRDTVLDLLVPDSGRAAREMSIFGVPVDRTRVKIPVLVIAGDDDRFIPVSRAHRVAARYRVALRVALGRGHMLVIEPGAEEICSWMFDWMRAEVSGGKLP